MQHNTSALYSTVYVVVIFTRKFQYLNKLSLHGKVAYFAWKFVCSPRAIDHVSLNELAWNVHRALTEAKQTGTILLDDCSRHWAIMPAINMTTKHAKPSDIASSSH